MFAAVLSAVLTTAQRRVLGLATTAWSDTGETVLCAAQGLLRARRMDSTTAQMPPGLSKVQQLRWKRQQQEPVAGGDKPRTQGHGLEVKMSPGTTRSSQGSETNYLSSAMHLRVGQHSAMSNTNFEAASRDLCSRWDRILGKATATNERLTNLQTRWRGLHRSITSLEVQNGGIGAMRSLHT